MADNDLRKFFSHPVFTSVLNMFLYPFPALLIFALCLPGCKPTQKQSAPPEKITIAYSTLANSALVHIAFAKGYFVKEGLEVIPQPHPFGKPALAAVIAGKADIATVADTPIVFAVMNGEKLSTLAVIQTSNRNEAVVALKDRGIIRPADLKGKKIGLPLGTTAHFFLDSFLMAHGIETKGVTLVDMKPVDMVAALDKKEVDAVSAFNPTLLELEKHLGESGVAFYGETLYTETFCVASSQEFVKKNPEAVKKFLKALIRAETFARENKIGAQNIVADFIKLDKDLLAGIWDIMTFRVSLDQALIVGLEDQTRWVLKNRLSTGTRMPNYLEYIHTEALYAVKPDAVRLVR